MAIFYHSNYKKKNILNDQRKNNFNKNMFRNNTDIQKLENLQIIILSEACYATTEVVSLSPTFRPTSGVSRISVIRVIPLHIICK